MIAVGVIGTGFGSSVHVPGFQAVEGATVVGVASAESANARETAKRYSLPRWFDHWRQLIAHKDIDAVSVATPPDAHAEIALAAMRAGKSVLCEKPLALDGEQAATMLLEARRAGVVHMVDFEFREVPAWQYAKWILENGDLGPVRFVNINWIVQSWGDPARTWTWRAERARGGGTLGAWGVHVFDYVEWILGPIRALASNLVTRIDRRPDATGAWRSVDAEDCCQLIMELVDGTPVSVMISPIAALGTGHHFEVFGAEKTLILRNVNRFDYVSGFEVWEGGRDSVALQKVAIPQEFQFDTDEQSGDSRIAAFARIAQRFINAVQMQQLEVRPSFEDGLRAQVLCDLAARAQLERRWIEVPAL